ncbi:peptidase family M48-domain-containing protein [Mycena latifolia]|nr:peptidase family M48-domain-containing protein [Mycena latifolia]
MDFRHWASLYSRLSSRLSPRACIGVAIGLLFSGRYVAHMENAPETGRRRFMAISEQEEEIVARIYLEANLHALDGRTLPLDHPLTRYTMTITRRILAASSLGHLKGDRRPLPQMPVLPDTWRRGGVLKMTPEKEWVVRVIKDRKIEAFAGHGLVCVSTGLIALAGDDAGLAAVIGHEIGHVVMRHTAEILSVLQGILPVLSLVLRLGLGPSILPMLRKSSMESGPASQTRETEGERMSPSLMTRACFDPGAAPRIFEDIQKLKKKAGKDPMPSPMDTHPPTYQRIAHLKSLLPETYAIYHANPVCAMLEDMRARGLIPTLRINIETGAISSL